MTSHTRRTAFNLGLVTALLFLLPPVAHAVDGTILITQNTVLAAGGFPYHISQPGSYRLASNLIVPNADTGAIQINASHVTLDLNGFAILGPTDCSGGLNPCAGAGTGSGIATDTARSNITIQNGTIQGMGFRGIVLVGDGNVVSHMHIRSNGGGGVVLGATGDLNGSVLEYSTIQRNGAGLSPPFENDAVFVAKGRISHNVVDTHSTGVTLTTGSLLYNVITRCLGVDLGNGAAYIGNVLNEISNSNQQVFGGKNLGQNLCNGAVCPGAQF